MPENKTKETQVSVTEFIHAYVDNETKKKDSIQLIELMSSWTGCEAKMWGPSIIGFGSYHYEYASGHKGEAPIIGFSPRKAAFSLYVHTPSKDTDEIIENLGKYKMSKACIYVKKLADIDLDILKKLSKHSIAYIKAHYECGCRQ